MIEREKSALFQLKARFVFVSVLFIDLDLYRVLPGFL